MRVTLIARPQFLPMSGKEVRYDQMLGPDGQQVIEFAGRVCYDSFGVGRDSESYAENILESGHGSVLEHAQYTFVINDASRNLMAELTRHHAGVGFSIRSTRFCDETDTPVAFHPLLVDLFEHRVDFAKRFFDWLSMGRVLYSEMVTAIQDDLVENHFSSKMNARKHARGAARAALSSALETEIVMSANARALRHIIESRGSIHADLEIVLLADQLLEIMQKELPAYFKDYTKSAMMIGYSIDTVYKKV